MGLDIAAYRGLKAAPDAALDEDGYPLDFVRFWRANPSIIDFSETHWPGRTEGFAAGIYSFAEVFRFRAGSYMGYNRWRDRLASLVGHGTAQSVWNKKPAGPFVELIDFADNEGVIGPVVAAKLALDFASYQGLADRHPESWFRQRFADWRKAFEMAADNGAVLFY